LAIIFRRGEKYSTFVFENKSPNGKNSPHNQNVDHKIDQKKETLLRPGLLLALPFTIETFELNAPTNGPKFGAATFEEGGAVSTAETLPAFSFHFSFTMLTTICFQFSMLNIYQCYGCHLQRRAIMH